MRIALFEPDIPQNTGAILRLCACLDVEVDIIGPAGFVLTDAKLRRAGLDYAANAIMNLHDSWAAFTTSLTAANRLILLTTKGKTDHRGVTYKPDDVLLLGRESAGVPGFVHDAAELRITIPLAPTMRSLNVVTAAAIVLGEALRQTEGFPGDPEAAPRS
jgi:tRNA (cytidine/uridine-2'-O-)-methyltransferase